MFFTVANQNSTKCVYYESNECGSDKWFTETVLQKFDFDLQYTICNFGNFSSF